MSIERERELDTETPTGSRLISREALATIEQKLAEATQRRDMAEREVVELTASRDSLQAALENTA